MHTMTRRDHRLIFQHSGNTTLHMLLLLFHLQIAPLHAWMVAHEDGTWLIFLHNLDRYAQPISGVQLQLHKIPKVLP
jgi:hypothetical protein